MIKAILFDYGGTLDTAARHWSYVIHDGYKSAGVDLTQDDFREAYVYAERALAKYRYIRPDDDFLSLLRKKITIEVEYLLQHQMWNPQSIDAKLKLIDSVALFCNRYAYGHICHSAKILSQLSAKYKLVMVSNFYGNLPTVLRTYGIDHYFSGIVESATVGVRKPNPDIYKLGVETAGVNANECLVIGDSYSKDIVPGHKVGCTTVWFKGEEWNQTCVDETLPDYIITSLEDVLNLNF